MIKKRILFLIIFLCTAILITGGVFAIQDHTKTPTPGVENREEWEDQERNEKSTVFSEREDIVDEISLKLYGERVGMDESVVINTSNWNAERNDSVDFSFRYPDSAEITNKGNCYRVEYGLGFAIFFLPIEGENRCGARTGVGVLPDNVNVTDLLAVGGEMYEAPGFHVVVDTQGEVLYDPEKRYFYDFHHMFDLNTDENCKNAGECMRVGYGIYTESESLVERGSIDTTMDTLRAIVESVRYSK